VSALSEYLRLIMYPLMALSFIYGIIYFPKLRWLFLSLSIFFGLFAVALLILLLGEVELNTWARTWFIPVGQVAVVVSLWAAIWQTQKRGGVE
jgi:hypothetical protein